MPQMLAQSELSAAEVTQVQKLLGDFLRFMQKNHVTIFVQEYEDAEPVRVSQISWVCGIDAAFDDLDKLWEG